MLSKYRKFQRCSAADYSAYDGSQRDHLRLFESDVVNQLCGKVIGSVWAVLNTEANGITGPVEAVLQAQMNSGTLTTATTNTYLNEMLIKYAFSRTGAVLGQDYDFLVEGDDNLIFYNDPAKYDQALEHLRSLGLAASVEHFNEFSDITFVGLGFFYDEH